MITKPFVGNSHSLTQMDESNSSFSQQPNGKIFGAQISHHEDDHRPLFPQLRIPPDFMPNGSKSLAKISEHAYGLGIVLGICVVAAAQLVYAEHYLWRIPFFVAALAVFHYLEFEMTARYNPTDAKISSFLLFTNGRAYNIAHTAAITEAFLRYRLTQDGHFSLPFLPAFTISVPLGIMLIVLGQTFRSLAMKQAGTSFNHIVQSSKKEDHVLITKGVYSVSRHPSYFGFFWWGLGTQVLLGNPICFAGYAAILWKFFAHRIMHEEKHLVDFFGRDYDSYRRSTPVLIPFIS